MYCFAQYTLHEKYISEHRADSLEYLNGGVVETRLNGIRKRRPIGIHKKYIFYFR